MTKVVQSTEYSANSIFVGCAVNEDGEPLVEINGEAIGTVADLLDFLGKYERQQKTTVNVRLAATGGYFGPRGYKVTAAVDDGRYRKASLLMDVPVGSEPRNRVVMKAGKIVAIGDDDGGIGRVKTLDELSSHLANVEIKDAHIGPLVAGSTNIEGRDDRIARLQRELDDLKSSMPRRIEEAIKSATVRNVRRY